MGRYTTAATFRTFKINGSTLDLTAYSDAELEAEITIAENLIDHYTGQFFDQQTRTLYLEGTGTRSLPLAPQMSAPLVSVTTLKNLEPDGVTFVESLVEGTDFFKGTHSLDKPLDQANVRNRIASSDARSVWLPGSRRYELVGEFGYATTPPEVIKATHLLAAEALKKGSTGLDRSDALVQRWDDYTVERAIGNTSPRDPSDSTGFSYVDRLLVKYRVTPSLFLDATGATPASLEDTSPVTDRSFL